MLKTLALWEWRRLAYSSKGALWALLLFPGLLFLPWPSLGLFESGAQASLIIITIYSIMIAAIIAGDAGHRTGLWFWLCQQGFRSAEIALGTAVASAALGMAFMVLGLSWYAILVALDPAFGFRNLLVAAVVLPSFTFVGQALLFFLNSTNVQRKAELLMAFALLSLVSPGLFLHAPRLLGRAMHLLLPPFADSFAMAQACMASDWAGALGYLLHISVFVSVAVWSGYLLHARNP